jgi:REP element-mobilizing transposase RayT
MILHYELAAAGRFLTIAVMPAPIYTAENSRPAYQLDWSLAVFWRKQPAHDDWLVRLQQQCEPEGIRILQHQFASPATSQFLVSTRPEVVPQAIVQRIKGRLPPLVRDELSDPLQRNYALRSIGSTRREKLEQYLAGQLAHHPLADPRTEALLRTYQIHHPHVDLSQPTTNSYARYWHNLHLVFIHVERGRDTSEETLGAIRQMLLNASERKGHLLSRAAILPDHLHLTLRCAIGESPQEVALGYMNNLAFACGMRPAFQFGYFAGTFSEYDLGVIPRA